MKEDLPTPDGPMMTSDGDEGQRLTELMDPGSRQYWRYSVLLWADILRRFPYLPAERERLLRHRLLVAHLRLARICLSHGNPTGLVHLLRAAAVSPDLFTRSLLKRRPSEEELLPSLAP